MYNYSLGEKRKKRANWEKDVYKGEMYYSFLKGENNFNFAINFKKLWPKSKYCKFFYSSCL